MDETLAPAAWAFLDLVGRIPHHAWAGPGLGDWDLRSLVGHTSRSLITVDSYLDHPAEREDLATPESYVTAAARLVSADPGQVTERGRQAGRALGQDPVGTIRALAQRVLGRVEDAGDPLIETIAGGMRLSSYLPTRTFELVVHSLDIARATRLDPPDWPQPVLLEVATIAARTAVTAGSGPAVILALTGRGPLPDGFSVV